ncbi:alcohol dehydrogenase catalytic domain-containing protein [Phytoactinopolyspora halotolerans]|uniref:Alcohol dehydrogenase catalytic domain-containing protein n=2 Tax=Phytoactinopolyspora halotolerans TaxID=1981512 RepID=A0A6L9SJY0_9ACTN|nr:alcohol dehydrogenase catalytic domain-containing protein [Phytoactinopolyspora halotolerans]
MRALVLKEYGEMALVERPVPAPREGDALIRVHATGICGSDLHGFTGENGRRVPGQVMGHETVGTVVSLGPETVPAVSARAADRGVAAGHADGPVVGDVVVVNPTIACGECVECAAGMSHICAERRVIGVDPALSSAFADYLVVPVSNAIPFRSTRLHGALVEPLAVGFHAAVRGAVTAADDVLVLGGGPIGQATALACRRLGAATVVVSEPVPGRRTLLEGLGIPCLDPTDVDVAAQIRSRTAGRGVSVTIDAVGSDESIATALDATAPGGRCVLVGMAAPRLVMPAFAVSTRERSIVGAFCYTAAEFAATAGWAEAAPAVLEALISARITPEDAPAAFSALAAGENPAGKVLVEFGADIPEPSAPQVRP